jgi:VWFA-related protein
MFSSTAVIRNYKSLSLIITLAFILSTSRPTQAQAYEKKLSASGKASFTIKNRTGRVSVIASDNEKDPSSLKATSTGAPVEPGDISVSENEIVVRERPYRIDLIVRVPKRSRVKIESETGMVDVIGDLEVAEVITDTGTIHADVPTDALKLKFEWASSRPRYLSDVELPKVKEGRGGAFSISGTIGPDAKRKKAKKKKHNRTTVPDKSESDATNSPTDPTVSTNSEKSNELKEPEKQQLVRLNFVTQRGVILLNVDPSMAPNDLRERPLTEAAKAIVRSGNEPLVDAVRKVSPRMFGDYARTLPPPRKEPTLMAVRQPGEMVTAVSPQLMRVNASVTDRNGRAIPGMRDADFSVYEDGAERKIVNVTPATEPFNLVLLLDVSGSVEERIDFIRKAARDFLSTVSPQDRISIIAFHDDIKIISGFTTDRRLLSQKLDELDAGGATALFDALAYTLVDTLKPLHGERTAVVIMSDGDDNKSFVPFPAVLEATIESGALIYPLYVPSGLIPEGSVPKPSITVDPMRSKYLTITTRAAEEGQKLADVSGGVFYSIKRIEDLQKAYDDVVAQMRTAYTITYDSNANPSGKRRVRVRTNRDGAAVRLSPAVSTPREN